MNQERKPLELSETERKIIIQYRKLTWLQPSIRKLLDIIEPDEKPHLINLRNHFPTAQGGEQ